MKHFLRSPLSALLVFLLHLFVFSDMLAQPQTVFYRAWARTSATLEEDFTNHVATLAAPSGETFVAGSTKNDNDTYSMILSKYQASGMLAWEAEFTVNDAGNVHVGNMALDASGNILVVGSAFNGSTNGYDLLLDNQIEIPSVQIFDLLGRQLYVPSYSIGNNIWKLDCKNINSGTYIVQFVGNTFIANKIFIKIK